MGASDTERETTMQTRLTARLSDREIVKNFLALPAGSLPAADWVDDGPEYTGSCWPYLRDYLRPLPTQRLNHDGSPIRLRADRDGWRDGVIVHAG